MSTIRVANVEFSSDSTKLSYYNDGIIRFISSGAMKLPTGNTSTRPTSEEGLFRYNTDTLTIEYRDSIEWRRLPANYISNASPSGGLNGDVWFKIP